MIPLRLVLAFAAIPAAAQTQIYPCEPAPEIARALADLPDPSDFRIPYNQRMQPLRDLLVKYPRDLFVAHRYQDAFRQRLYLYQEFDRALGQYRSRSADPLFRYLEARLTASFDPAKASQMLDALLRDQPSFAWPHLAMAALTDRLGARDAKRAEPHLRAFLSACPTSIEGLSMLRTVDDPEMIAAGARKLRSLLEARDDPSSLPSWRFLWDLEFRAAPQADQESVRLRVLNDVASLQKRPPVPNRDWYWLFNYAAELTKDPAIRTWVESTVLQRFPDSPIAPTADRARWSREHPRPARGATPDEYKAYSALEKAQLEELHRRYPDDFSIAQDRWLQLSSADASMPVEERLATADTYAALLRRSPDATTSTPPNAIQLASHYVKWLVRLDQVPSLIQAGLRDVELEHRYPAAPGTFPIDPIALTAWRAQSTLADLYLHQKDAARAREAIQLGLAAMERPTSSEQEKREREYRLRDWRLREERLAVLENRPPSEVSTSGSKPDALPPRQIEYSTPLPEFRAKDLAGRTWRLADLKGKATLIDIWATWCGGCRAEHPEIQKLYEQIKDRKDVQILTLSMDDTSYLAESYLKEFHYTFPAIVSQDLLNGAFPMGGLPQAWIVDPQGRRSSPLLLWDTDRILAELEKAAHLERK